VANALPSSLAEEFTANQANPKGLIQIFPGKTEKNALKNNILQPSLT
jgi:hypothetical protein